MYEQYLAPIPDYTPYLKKLGLSAPTKNDEVFLSELVRAHRYTVPFENLSCSILKEPISLETEKLWNKIVLGNRGGYCFELNGLFHKLLIALGFDAYSCPCRITPGGELVRPISHRGNLVVIRDKTYFCDVGFGGPSPLGCIELSENKLSEVDNEIYYFKRVRPYWYLLMRKKTDRPSIPMPGKITDSEADEAIMLVSLAPWEPYDFIGLNETFSSPASRFSEKIMVNINRPNGHAYLNDSELTVVKNAHKTVTAYDKTDRSALLRILSEHFGIIL